jgi:hypothetical protein
MAQTREWTDSIIAKAVAEHEATGNATPTPEALDAVREWHRNNNDRIDRAISAGWKKEHFSERLTSVLGNAQKAATSDNPVGASHVMAALDDPISNGCNC